MSVPMSSGKTYPIDVAMLYMTSGSPPGSGGGEPASEPSCPVESAPKRPAMPAASIPT